jgi:hypothetical protein
VVVAQVVTVFLTILLPFLEQEDQIQFSQLSHQQVVVVVQVVVTLIQIQMRQEVLLEVIQEMELVERELLTHLL